MGFKLGKTKAKEYIEYKYFPKDRDELIDILRERVKENNDANLNDIDVSNVTDMSALFAKFSKYVHNIDVSEWDVSNVENMEDMFAICNDFNCDLSNWDVSNVKNMEYMFFNCYKFEGKGLENWNISKKTNTKSMLNGCKSIKTMPSWWYT